MRVPKTCKFKIDPNDANDQYARLFAADVVDDDQPPDPAALRPGQLLEAVTARSADHRRGEVLGDLSRAGKRLMGFCRTNLFKRLESSGHAFMLSVERHILRNFICLHAIENGLPLPIGTQDTGLLDSRSPTTTRIMGPCVRRRRATMATRQADRQRLTEAIPSSGPPRSTSGTPGHSANDSAGCAPACS